MTDELLSRKELAAELKRSRTYVYALERCGLQVVGGRVTLTAAMQIIAKHPAPTTVLTKKNNAKQ